MICRGVDRITITITLFPGLEDRFLPVRNVECYERRDIEKVVSSMSQDSARKYPVPAVRLEEAFSTPLTN